MNVLSLFDGMSCGQIALKKLGAKVDQYFASEIDKYAIKVAKENFPTTIHVGDVTKIDGNSFVNESKIDLLIGGSPCQGFSKSGNRLNFDDPRSKLFFEFVRILRQCKPKYFMLENVVMNKESRDIISEYLGVEPIEINSNLVSAQSRRRLYWTNIPNVTVPEDKGIVIKDILEDNGVADMVINQGKQLAKADIKKSHCLMARDYKGFGNQGMTGIRLKDNPVVSKDGLNHVGNEIEIVKVRKHKVPIKKLQFTLRWYKKASGHYISEIAEHIGVPKTLAEHWFRTDKSFSIPEPEHWFALKKFFRMDEDWFDKYITEFEYREGVFEQSSRVYHVDGKAPTLTSTLASKQKVYIPLDKVESKNGLILKGHAKLNGHDVLKRVYDKDGKSPTLNTCGGGNREPKISLGDKQWRKLTPLECERLQTVPDNYTSSVSNTQRYKMLGNGWTVDVIAHLFKNITTKGVTYEYESKRVNNSATTNATN
jgi:site-specific DNA-cytosine methylase